MLRRLILSLMLAVVPLSGLAQTRDVAGQVASQLQAQGYRQIQVRRSLLGKVIISARRGDMRREIVVDPRSGVLRDLLRREGGSRSDGGSDSDNASRSGSSGSGSGSGSGGESSGSSDDDDDSDDDDRDDGDGDDDSDNDRDDRDSDDSDSDDSDDDD